MKKVEEGLRQNVQNLLAQISETEESGNATAEELRATLASTSQLLRNREQELSDEVLAKSQAAAAQQKAERQIDILKGEIESLKLDVSAVRKAGQEKEEALNATICKLREEIVCLTKPVVVVDSCHKITHC